MTGKKSRLFPGKSAKPDSSNINPSSSNNAAPSSSQRTGTSFALPITPQADAHPAQDEISEVGSSLTSDSRSLADAGRDKVSEIGSASTPSAPSARKRRPHARRLRETAEQYNQRIREATEGPNEESDVDDLYAAFNLISQLSDLIKKQKQDKKENKLSEPKLGIDSWLGSKNLLELKEVLYEAINAAKDFASRGDAKKMVRGFLKDIGGGHVFNIAFIVVANAWERYEDMSKNEEACLPLVEEINKMAKNVIELQKELQNCPELKKRKECPELKKRKEDVVKEAIEFIIENCIAFRTLEEKLKEEKLISKLKEKLKEENLKDPCWDWKELSDVVGIEDPLREVIERLEMGSDKNVVAVMVHGFGGMGKTTLANAVFARLFEAKTVGFKFSFVELFKDRETPPNIEESQKFILRDLKGDEPDEIRSYRGGQKQIEKEETFIYIYNVLLPADTREQGQDALTRLLPENMANAKKSVTTNLKINAKIPYVFGYDKLEDKWKDPFLDICSFFRGWDWKELSDIVGETALKKLEQRAFVTRDVKSMTARVHDVICEVGLQKTEGNRFRLTTATEIEKFSDIEDKDLQKIKGIWASDNKDPLRVYPRQS